MGERKSIPQPPGWPVLGNALDIDPDVFLLSMKSMGARYGEIYRLHLGGKAQVVLSSYRLVAEALDETRFRKSISAPLAEIRHGVRDGLFTARDGEPNWGIAHRVLMPAFGPTSIRGMFDEMHDVATQLAMKWARHGSDASIMVPEDFTKLSLDTLALCAMGFRFNSYYKDELHPFISAMGDFLVESGNRSRRPPLPSIFYQGRDAKFFTDIELLRHTASEVLQERKGSVGTNKREDLLCAMLNGVDPKSGERMSDDSIIDNLITFLIAGHETTSGLLSFAFYGLLKNPETYRKAQEEVDNVIGKGKLAVEHLPKLPYLAAVLRETLRLHSPIPIILVEPIKDEVIGHSYFVPAGETMVLLLSNSHLDPAVYGDDAHEFKPERMLDANFERLNKTYPNCWKPFGNGVRACIGRPFAWQEALLVMAMLLQNFNFVLDDPSYTLAIKQTLTIKPKDFRMRAILRDELTPTQLQHRLSGTPSPLAEQVNGSQIRKDDQKIGNPLSIYYGSNSGTCKSLAQRLAADAPSHGFYITAIDCMDSVRARLSTDQPIIFITASYEGQPPDNAALFVDWVENLKDDTALCGVAYAVFGCGHHDWPSTFHRIPKLVDSCLEKRGGSRIADIGLADVADEDVFSTFEAWEDTMLWPALRKKYGTTGKQATDIEGQGLPFSIQITNPRLDNLRLDLEKGRVLNSGVLTAEGEPVKRWIEIKLPENMTYTAGDYLAVLPLNTPEEVLRAMRRFDLPWDAHITINGANMETHLPVDVAVAVSDIFSSYVELARPATKRNILTLEKHAKRSSTKARLQTLAADAHASEAVAKNISILDLLESYTDIDLPLSEFLSMLPPLRTRQYSIASSPL
ncbi:hypothetical protein O1611_g91 [Lasiodiplodia mahajangana]|uniref:Uncharacterized protein n=1 Tax=Lasiodiplodia mahajangana TaxID=1108764 RepID=A0ACC2K200_9PEZI|nr:hypothetical protein O1611_g91 [Lasiodiplodia mahajangana]